MIFLFLKTFLASLEAEICRFLKETSIFFLWPRLGLVLETLSHLKSTQTFEDLYSLTKLDKVAGSFIRWLYFHIKRVEWLEYLLFKEGFPSGHSKKGTGHIHSPIFGPTWTWNDTWMGHRSAQHIFSHCLGCVFTHYAVSRLNFSSNMASCHLGVFDPKNTHIRTHLDLELHLGGA